MSKKFVALAVVVMLLFVGLFQISGVVRDRQDHRAQAVRSVAASVAGAQTLVGPLIHSACVEEADTVGKYSVPQRREFMHVALPTELVVNGVAQLVPRGRGLHTTQVFTLNARISAEWTDLNALKPKREYPGSRMNCGPAVLMLAVSDARGIRQASVKLGADASAAALPLKAGTFHPTYPRGVHALLPSSVDWSAPLSAQIDLELAGTEQLSLVPLGANTQVALKSNWPHPSFGGAFLPASHGMSDKGFEASWRVSALASGAQGSVLKQRPPCARSEAEAADCTDTLSVAFIDPGNSYALSDRATKYGLLFVVLTFLAVGMFEVLQSLRVHPVQYFLVGAALCVFFLLLVSLSEHWEFAHAYLAAASGCVMLLTFYGSFILGGWLRGLPFGLGIALLYGLLYTLLQMEQKALVVGSVALFGVLALVMAATRKVDWYSKLQTQPASEPAPAPESQETVVGDWEKA